MQSKPVLIAQTSAARASVLRCGTWYFVVALPKMHANVQTAGWQLGKQHVMWPTMGKGDMQ